jgi:hypothetical protein
VRPRLGQVDGEEVGEGAGGGVAVQAARGDQVERVVDVGHDASVALP